MYKNSTQTPHVVSSTQTSYFQAYCLAYSNTHSLYSRLHFWPVSGIITLLVFSFFLAFIPQIKSKEKIGAHFFFLPFRRVIDRKPLKTLRIERSIFLFDWCGVLFFFSSPLSLNGLPLSETNHILLPPRIPCMKFLPHTDISATLCALGENTRFCRI